jgi:hypothetical protein
MDTMKRLKDLAISDSGFLFDPCTGLTFTTNPPGQVILRKLREGLAPDAIEPVLRAEFDLTDVDDPARDVREFLLLLREHGILPRDEPAAPHLTSL